MISCPLLFLFPSGKQSSSVGRKASPSPALPKNSRFRCAPCVTWCAALLSAGSHGLEPDYARCATNKVATDSVPFQKAIEMRKQHPGWGGGLIRVFLQEQDNDSCPSERTLQRWFRRSALSPGGDSNPKVRIVSL